MKTGLLWLDDRRDVPFYHKLAHASSYYQEKYGHRPDLCFVHPSCLPSEEPGVDIVVRSSDDILPDHFWLGRQRA